MSRPRPDLKNDEATARAYVEWLRLQPFIEEILLSGSRLIGREKPTSDWDFVVVSSIKGLTTVKPRDSHLRLHGDIVVVTKDDLHHYKTGELPWTTS